MAGFNPSEPRVDAGSAAGGQWGGGGSADDQKKAARSAAAKKAAATRASKKGSAPAKGSAKGAGWHGGKARDANAAKAQADAGAQKLYDELLALPQAKRAAYVKGLSDADLEKLTGAVYSERTSDPNIVGARIAVANEMSHRGLDVKKFGALGGGGTSRPSASAAPQRRVSPAQVRAVAQVQARRAAPTATPAPKGPLGGGAPTGQRQYGRTRAI